MPRAVLLNDTRIDRHHGCTSVIETIHALAAANAITITATSPVHSDWQADAAFCAALDDADLVLVNGEGTIHHDRPAGLRLLSVGPHAAKRAKPAVMLNCTWQANGAGALEMLRSFAIVSVRESASEAELTGHGIAVRRIPDLALFHEPEPAVRRSGIAFGDSVKGETALALYRAMKAHDGTPLPIVRPRRDPASVLRWARRYAPSYPALLNPANARDIWGATRSDVAHQIERRDDYTKAIAASRLVVTGRFHAMILALAAGTPLLAVGSNTHKIEATLADAGLAPWRALRDASTIDAALLERAARWHEGEEERLRAFTTASRSAMRRLFADIADLAGSGP